MKARTIDLDDDLHRLVNEINSASWDDSNEMSRYDVESLKAYLSRQDTVFVACHADAEQGGALLGIASSRIELKPYENETWLYVDEVDVCSDQRRKGAGRLIMRALLEIAEERGCKEVWLAAEADNDPANALYRSLNPDEVAKVIGYAYEMDE